jgi:ribosomal-protein-alanine N-acetyltransferase
MMGNIGIRTIAEDDYEVVCQLEQGAAGCLRQAAVFVRQQMVLTPRLFLVAEVSGCLAGYLVAMLTPDDPSRAWILRLRVREEVQRQGVGTALLDYVHTSLEGMGATQVWLSCSPANEGALILYTRAGYLISGCSMGYFGPGEDRYILSRILPGG